MFNHELEKRIVDLEKRVDGYYAYHVERREANHRYIQNIMDILGMEFKHIPAQAAANGFYVVVKKEVPVEVKKKGRKRGRNRTKHS